jgi:predicted GTPase
MQRERVLILGAAGRDFHDFNVVFRDDDRYDVVAFTAQQIPHIADRRYPALLAGPHYPAGIPIEPEEHLEQLIDRLSVDTCVMAYSDVSHEEVMHLASRANATGADFRLIGTRRTMLRSRLPVVAICASRTGAGKSQTSRAVTSILRDAGLRVGILRHPMPYGRLAAQRVQRFASEEDLLRHRVTIEEREEYEPHIAAGSVVWAGVDYAAILRAAEDEADVIVWDGGNNDTSFLHADVYITVLDPHRAGHELRYHPGETNLRLATSVVINKVDSADAAAVAIVRGNVEAVNPRALVIEAESPVTVDRPELLRGRRVLAVEDGPTVTHGGMRTGAATLGALHAGAKEIVDPRPFAVGEIRDTFDAWPQIGALLPAMGYGSAQVHDLEITIARAARGGVEALAIGTPIDLSGLVTIPIPWTRVSYDLRIVSDTGLEDALAPVFERLESGEISAAR